MSILEKKALKFIVSNCLSNVYCFGDEIFLDFYFYLGYYNIILGITEG